MFFHLNIDIFSKQLASRNLPLQEMIPESNIYLFCNFDDIILVLIVPLPRSDDFSGHFLVFLRLLFFALLLLYET